MIKYLSKVLYVLSGSKGNLVFILLLFIFSSILEAIGIGLIGPFLNLASHPELIHTSSLLHWMHQRLELQSNEALIPVVGFSLAILFCVKSFVYFLVQRVIFRYSFDQSSQLSVKLLKAYLSAPYTFYLRKNTADLISNMTNETHIFCYEIIIPLLQSVSNFVVLILLVLLLAKTDLVLLAIILGILLPTFLLFFTFRHMAKRWGKEASEAYRGIIQTIHHSFGGVKETYVIGCQFYFEDQMRSEAEKFARSATAFHSFDVLPRITVEAIFILFLVLLVSVYQLLLGTGIQQLLPVLSIFAFASIRLIPSASQFIAGTAKLQMSSYALDQLYYDLKTLKTLERSRCVPSKGSNTLSRDRTSYPDSTTTCLTPNQYQRFNFEKKVSLENITYQYPETTVAALKAVSFSFFKGESIALIGKSGSGKTTLVDVILGLLEPLRGDIFVDEVSIYDNLTAWRNLIGYIPQSIFLTDDTIERNIAFGVPDGLIDTERLTTAIHTAQLTDLVEQLPHGVKTYVGERGIRLSGGQRQRIGIARAIYHDREILVLDEATSALDNETEALVNESIQALSGIKTLIIIAHRLTTVQHCDRIYQIENGHILKSGSYEEVVVSTST